MDPYHEFVGVDDEIIGSEALIVEVFVQTRPFYLLKQI